METTHVSSCPLNQAKCSGDTVLPACVEWVNVAPLAPGSPDAQLCECRSSQENRCCVSAGFIWINELTQTSKILNSCLERRLANIPEGREKNNVAHTLELFVNSSFLPCSCHHLQHSPSGLGGKGLAHRVASLSVFSGEVWKHMSFYPLRSS